MKTGVPSISVVMPAFNGARFLESAVESIKLQEWPDLELILVDDGSTDDLAVVVERLNFPVTYIRQEQRGPAAARNAGIGLARAPLIAFLDVDDTWTAGHLSRLHAALVEHPEAGIAQGKLQQYAVYPDGRRILSGSYLNAQLGTCLFRREVLMKMHCLDERMLLGEDYDLIFRCWEADVVKILVDEVSLIYRRHPENMTKGKNNEAHIAVVRRRLERIRSGIVDPAAPHAISFMDYSGRIENFWIDQVEMAS